MLGNGRTESLADRASRRALPRFVPEKTYGQNISALKSNVEAGLQQKISSDAIYTNQLRRPLPRGRVTGPVRFAATIMDNWHVSLSDITRLLGFEPADQRFVQDILSGLATPRGRDFKDRIACLYTLHTLLVGLFRNKEAVNEWLREPQPRLNQRPPLQLLLEGSMENMYRVKYLVEHIAGR